MSSRPTITIGEDPEETARLPTIDPIPGADDSLVAAHATDVLPMPAVPAGTSELADRLREVELRLNRKDDRVRELELLLEQSGQRQAAQEAELVEARARQAELEARLDEAREHAQTQSRLVVERRSAAVRHHEQDYSDLRNRNERQMEALCSWEGFRGVSEAMLDDAEARNALLEAKISSLTESVRALESGRPRGAPQGQSEALKAEVRALQAQVTSLRAELAVARMVQPQSRPENEPGATRAVDRKAPGPVEAPDLPVNATVVMYGDRWEYTEEPTDSPTGELEAVPPPVPPAESPVRALVRQDGGGELIYPVGKRTTIGRTPDNDVQIDAPNVSRHHAVLLVSADHCRIEDLNSTNGVMVNGARVIRQELQDGDTLTIGKAEFRFLQRT